MKKLTITAFIMVLLVAQTIEALGSGFQSKIDPPSESVNLIPFGDFEADTLPWIYAWGAANATFVIDNNSALNGEGSLKIAVLNPSTSGSWWDTGIKNAFELSVEKGESYVFSFISKAEVARQMHFDVKVGNVKLLDKAIDLTADAKKFTFGFTASVSGNVTIQFMPTIHGATVYFDDLSFVKLDAQQIPNGDFEAENLPWHYGWGAANASFSIDNTSQLNGEGSLKIDVLNPSTTGAWWDAGIRNSFPVYVEKDQVYVFSFVAKADEARQMHFDAKVGDVKLLDKAIDLTADKKKFTFGFTASVSGMVTIQFMPTIHGATVYFDDLSFVKLGANQMPNGDFEAVNLPWHYGWGAANASFSIDNTSQLNGEGSLKIEVLNPSTTGAWWDAGIRNSFPVYVEKGQVYVFSFVAKAVEARQMHFDAKVGDLKLLDKAIDLTADAKKFNFGFKSSVSGMVTIQFMPTIHGATVYIDDLSFVKLDANQIPNGNFETDMLPWIYGWGAANASFSIDNTSQLNGKGSLKIEVLKPSTTGAWWDAGIRNNFPVYVEKGLKYEFKFDAKAAEARQMHFDVKVGDVKLLDKAIDLTTDKQAFSFSFIASVSGMVTIQWMPTIAGATVYLDNISLAEGKIILVESITVTGADNATEINKVGGMLKMSASILPANADITKVVWSVENGTGEATISDNGMLTAVANGTVVVKATATDGSKKEGETTITISGQETGVAVLESKLRIYPNPASSQITVSSNFLIKRVDVISIDGRVLQSSHENDFKVNVPMHALRTGVYIIRITDENDQQRVHKITKQ